MRISVDDLRVELHGSTILESVTFSVTDEVLGIVGPNGSGKSTLLQTIESAAWKRRPDVVFSGPHGRGPRVGYLPQKFSLPRGLTVREFIEYAAWVRGVRNIGADATSALESMDLLPFADVKLGRVSGGIAQRAGFAAVIVDQPEILLLDEPTTGVDIQQREVMRSLISRQSAGRVTILSSHISEDIEELCDRVLILVDGRVRLVGSVDDAKNEAGVPDFASAVVKLTGDAL